MKIKVLCIGLCVLLFGRTAYGEWSDEQKEAAKKVISTFSTSTVFKIDDQQSLAQLAAAYVIDTLSASPRSTLSLLVAYGSISLSLFLEKRHDGSYKSYWAFPKDIAKFGEKIWESAEDVTKALYPRRTYSF
jgi:hypothetical protein